MLISIIIPTKDENDNLQRLLSNLYVPADLKYEIIIADGNELQEPVSTSIRLQENIAVVKNKMGFTPHGINSCLKLAKGQYIMLCGAHSYICKSYIKECIRQLDDNPNYGCVGGRIIHRGFTSFGKSVAAAMGAPFGMGINSFRSRNKSGFVDTVSVPVFRKNIFDTIGGFDEMLIRNQDDDFSYRLSEIDYKIYQDISVWSEYHVREDVAKLTMQFFQYGFWKPFLLKKHKSLTTYRQIIPPLLLCIFLFILVPLSFYTYNVFFISIPALLYIIGVFVSAMYASIKTKSNIFKICFAMAIMHVSYAVGYLTGLYYTFFDTINQPDFSKNTSR
jgi:GT2 family glycosyltransferase